MERDEIVDAILKAIFQLEEADKAYDREEKIIDYIRSAKLHLIRLEAILHNEEQEKD